MKRIITAINTRLAQPGDSDVQRRQRLAAFLAGVAGLSLSLFTMLVYFASGANLAAWSYWVLVVYMLAALTLLLAVPRLYAPLVMVTSLVVTIHPWLIHVATGGFDSGLMAAPWSLFGPISAMLLLGLIPALVNAAVFVVCALLSIPLTAQMMPIAPVISAAAVTIMGYVNLLTMSAMIFAVTVFLVQQLDNARRDADGLLLNILPVSIANQLKKGPATIAERRIGVTVLFADVVEFTRLSAGADPVEVVETLNDLFSEMDDLADKHGLEKIKTIGDAYMVACGLSEPCEDHCERIGMFACDLLLAMSGKTAWNGEPLRLRIGMQTGDVVAGVIGRRKFSYDLWGDVVNTASRMEQYGLPDEIQVTSEVAAALAEHYDFEPRGPLPIKGKGEMTTYLLRPKGWSAAA